MRLALHWLGTLLLSTLCTLSASAAAQTFDAEIRVDQLQPPSPDSRFTRTEGPVSGFDSGVAFSARLTADYAYQPLLTRVIGGAPNVPGQPSEQAIVEHAVLTHITAGILPVEWLMVEMSMPFALHLQGSPDLSVNGQPVAAGTGPGVGEPRFGLLFRPYESDAVDVTFGGRLWAPLGTVPAYMSGPARTMRGEVVFAIAGNADVLDYGCTLGVAPLFFVGRDGDRAALSCAAHFKLAPMVSLGVEPHAALFSYAPNGAEDRSAPGLGEANLAVQFEPLAALSVQYKGVGLTLAGGPGLGGAPGTATGRGILSLSYSHRGERVVEEAPPSDRDMDGVVDDFDGCPDEAGPKARSGCPPDRDLDGDGIIADDACPREAGARYDEPAANGCPDVDNDHFADPVDSCPIEPGKRNGCPRFARLRKDVFVVNPPMRFYRGNNRMPSRTRAALIEIIATMRANSDLPQISISLGTKGASRRLTDLRAQRLLTLMRDQNFDSSRYEVVLSDTQTEGTLKVRVVR